jgi:hypothetical protein
MNRLPPHIVAALFAVVGIFGICAIFLVFLWSSPSKSEPKRVVSTTPVQRTQSNPARNLNPKPSRQQIPSPVESNDALLPRQSELEERLKVKTPKSPGPKIINGVIIAQPGDDGPLDPIRPSTRLRESKDLAAYSPPSWLLMRSDAVAILLFHQSPLNIISGVAKSQKPFVS